jgi:uncharacterized protein (TIGR03437 family)
LKKITLILTLILALAATGALSAQTITVSPTSLTFTAASNGTAQTQQLAVTNASGAPQFTAYVTSGTWLTITAPGGVPQTGVVNVATPASLTITANPAGLAPNAYSGSITLYGVSATGTFGPTQVLQVTFNVGNLGVSPASVSFTYQSNSGQVPAATNLTLTAASATAYTTSLSGSDCAWLQQPANGTVTGTATVSVALVSAVVTGLSVGAHTCNLVITPATGPAVTVPVTLTVAAAPTITFTPSSISLVYQTTSTSVSTNTPAQTLTLTNPGTQALSYFVSPGAPWLTATPDPAHPTSIPAGGSVNVTIAYLTSSNLAPNTPANPLYSSNVGIFVPGASNSTFNVPVSLLISSSPLVVMSTAPVSFTYQVGTSVPAAKTVTATTTAVESSAPASQQIPLFVTAATTSGGNWLSCQGLATCVQQQVQGTSYSISLNASVVQALAPGTYSGTISVFGFNTANATSSAPLVIPVTLKVSNDPLVTATFGGCTMGLVTGLTCPINFPYQVGQNNPVSQLVTIGSNSNVALTVTPTVTQNTIAGCVNWLSVSAVSSPSSTTEAFTVSANPAGVPNGTVCTGSVSVAAVNPVSGNASPNSPLTIPVSLYVNNTAMLVVNPIALSFTVQPNVLSASQFVAVTSTGTSASDQINFTASRPNGDSWLLVDTTPNKSTAAGSISVAVYPTSLAPGTYTSTITLTAAGSGVLDSPLTVPVVMTITGASVTADKTSLSFNQTAGGSVPASQNVTLTASGGTVAYSTAVTYQSGQATGWLNATQSGTIASGSTGTVQVSVNGTNLAAGTYNGTVTISAAGVTGSPIAIPVTLTIAQGTLSVAPTTVTFNEVQGTSPQSQNVAVSSNPAGLTFTVSTSSNAPWLTATANTSTTPATLQLTASNAGLSPNTYFGTVTVTSPGATGSPQTVNVTLTVVAAQTITVTPATLNFSYTIGTQTTLQAQTVQVSSSGGAATFTATPSTNASWLVVSPTTGTTPATLTVSINPGGLAAGSYTGTIAITSSSSATSPAASITVNLTVVAVPKPVITAIQNAASAIVGPISPGENIVIYGSNIGPATLTMSTVSNNTLSNNVGQTQVFFDGIAAPIYYSSSGQTSVFVPYGIAGRATTLIVVSVQGVQSTGITQSVSATVPGIYTLNSSGSGPAVAWNYDLNGNFTGINSASIPAVKGGVVSLYVTGEGVTNGPAGIDGMLVTNLYKPLAAVTATVGGQTAPVQYAGSAPGSIYGVMQVNIQIPAGAASGTAIPLVVNVGGNNSQANVTIAIQ